MTIQVACLKMYRCFERTTLNLGSDLIRSVSKAKQSFSGRKQTIQDEDDKDTMIANLRNQLHAVDSDSTQI